MLPVILFHAGVAGFSGGFIGVDVFFVVSGYLITSIIVQEIGEGAFTLGRFYERRVRRIFPALFFVVLCSIPAALVILVPKDLEDFGQSVIATALFTSNFFFFLENGYFEGPAELHPLLHTWSLAVEEQFYLLFPLLLMFAARRLRGYGMLLISLGAMSFGFGVWQQHTNPDAAFYLLPGRFWELLCGALLAVYGTRMQLTVGLSAVMACLGIVLIGYGVFAFDAQTRFPGVAALVPCLGAFLILLAGRTDNVCSRLLGSRLLTGIGLISYSLYLWHFPLIVYSKHLLVRPFTAMEFTLLLTASLTMAFLSWRYVERPFRSKTQPIPRRQLVWFSSAAIASSVAFGLYTDFSDGAPNRMSDLARTYLDASADKSTACMRELEGCEIGPLSAEPRFLLWGDSHASALLPVFRALAAETGIPGKAALRGGCLPLLGYRLDHKIASACEAHVRKTLEALLQSEIGTVFISARWTMVVEESMYGYESGTPLRLLDIDDTESAESNREILQKALDRTLTELMQAGKRVVVIGPIPEIGWHVPNTLAQRQRFSGWLGGIAISPTLGEVLNRNQRTLQLLQQAADRHDARLVSLHPVLCDSISGCRVLENGKPLYFDTDHLTKTGALQFLELFRPEFTRMR